MAADSIKKKQIEIAERLQLKWLERMEKLMDEDKITSTDMANLRKFLQDSGWTVDETKLPSNLRDKLKESLDAEDPTIGDDLPMPRLVRNS